MTWSLLYTKQAKKDATRIEQAGLRGKTQQLLDYLPKIPSKIRRRMKNWSATLAEHTHGESASSIVSCIKCCKNNRR